MGNKLFDIEDVKFSYKLGTQMVNALRGVSLHVDKGCLLCLIGPSGSGKTTLLNLLGLIEPLQEGQLLFSGKNLGNLSEAEKNKIRKFDIGFIFQYFHLFPVLTAEENVEFFLSRQGVPKAERKQRVADALNEVGIYEQRLKRPLEMSGGQRQRVAIARAVAKQPAVIIADEPTANLDQKTGREIMEILSRLNQERQTSIIISSHDAMVQEYIADKVSLLDGVIC